MIINKVHGTCHNSKVYRKKKTKHSWKQWNSRELFAHDIGQNTYTVSIQAHTQIWFCQQIFGKEYATAFLLQVSLKIMQIWHIWEPYPPFVLVTVYHIITLRLYSGTFVLSSNNCVNVTVANHICFIDKVNLLLIFLGLKSLLGLLSLKIWFPSIMRNMLYFICLNFLEGIILCSHLIQDYFY